MIPYFEYKIPNTIDETLDMLWENKERTRIIAGGTDLVIRLRNGDENPESLVDITRVEELRRIEEKDGIIYIGASVTHFEIASSLLIAKYGSILSEASSQIGSPQVRNLGTIGGNIINASPAADTLPPLLVLDAMARVASKEGEKDYPVSGLIKAPYQSTLKPYELLVSIFFEKLPPDAKSSFIRLSRREGMTISRMSIAIVLRREGDRISDVRIAVGSVTPIPQRMKEVESFLINKLPKDNILREVSKKLSEEMIRISGIRPSTSYKAPVIEALFIRAMKEAYGND